MATKDFPTQLPQKAVPASNDTLLIADASAGNAAKYANLGDLPVPSSVTSALASKEDKANKGQPNGYAPLDGTGKVPLANLPAGGWTGDVVWPASATDNALARFDATTGKLIQNGVVTESDNGDLSAVNAVSLATAPTLVPTAVGTLSWNQDEDTMDIRQLGSILQVGQELQWNVRNNTASTILEGTAVYVTGTIGASGRMTVAPFVANGSIPSMYYLGIMTQDVLPGADGKATTFGKIRQINTSTWNDGDVLYCSPTVAGQLTNVKPSTPNYVIPTAFVIHSATNGTIAVRVPTLHEADEVNYSNAVSLLTASNVQDAIDELNFEKVNKTTTVNGHSLATDVTLTASDVGAPSGSGTSTGTNTGDQDLSGLVPKTRTLTINGTAYDLSADRSWTVSAGSSLWTAVTATRTGNTTFTVTGDQTATFSRGLVVKWTESSAVKCGYVVSSAFTTLTTVTIVGDTMVSIDSGSLKWTATPLEKIKGVVAGDIGAAETEVGNVFYAHQPLRILACDLDVGTAGTTDSTTIDVNKNGTTMFTTKPTLASGVAYSSTPFTADSGSSIAVGDRISFDVDAVQATPATDLYVTVYAFPTLILNLA